MRFPSKEQVKQIRNEFPKGTRVELVSMDDRQAPPPGTKGTVIGVDDTGSLLMRWDNGSGLNVVYGEDVVQKLKPEKTVKTICYGEEQVWESRRAAMDYFFDAMMGSDGSEKQRYTNVYTKLLMGWEVCSDDR